MYDATLGKINLLLSTKPAYPLGSLGIKAVGFLIGLGYTEALNLFYYCPLNHDMLAHVCAWRKNGLTLTRESALLVIFAATKLKR